MKIYLISQDKNDGYDSYDSAVVVAENEMEAKRIPPSGEEWDGKEEEYGSWSDVEDVKVEYLGEAKEGTKKGVICASFNAG